MTHEPSAGSSGTGALQLLSGFALTRSGADVLVSAGCQRLVALLAVNGVSSRAATAGLLWPDVPDSRAGGNLRSSLWRINRAWPGLVTSDEQSLSLSRAVVVDADRLAGRARSVADASSPLGSAGDYTELVDAGELLPGWYDDWVIVARERLRLLRLHALELLSERLLQAGQLVWAMEAAMATVRDEPLRESGHRAVLAVHVASGNVHEARRYCARLTAMLRSELGVEPSASLRLLAQQLEVGRDPQVPEQRVSRPRPQAPAPPVPAPSAV